MNAVKILKCNLLVKINYLPHYLWKWKLAVKTSLGFLVLPITNIPTDLFPLYVIEVVVKSDVLFDVPNTVIYFRKPNYSFGLNCVKKICYRFGFATVFFIGLFYFTKLY
jgi:hypothetical protein